MLEGNVGILFNTLCWVPWGSGWGSRSSRFKPCTCSDRYLGRCVYFIKRVKTGTGRNRLASPIFLLESEGRRFPVLRRHKLPYRCNWRGITLDNPPPPINIPTIINPRSDHLDRGNSQTFAIDPIVWFFSMCLFLMDSSSVLGNFPNWFSLHLNMRLAKSRGKPSVSVTLIR